MFRIESYVTSIILSYVDRYIKNFKRQDAQVSLWEGDGSLHNLDLDLEVLDQELNLPFSLVSGHIHELLIHVPWTRIASEPVKITINTIECIMKLKPPGQENAVKKDKKKKTQTNDECITPPSYMSSLVNKIIFNLSVTCNNLILKYVEEDIVLSMNIKTLSLSTVNKQWVPEFSELSATQLVLRNLVNLSDVTICLDKRNASGRIEAYMDPILYKCSLTIRISRSFPTVGCSVASTTRIGIKCDNFALSISQPQVPMLIRLVMLVKSMVNSTAGSNSTSQLSLDTDDNSIASDGDGQYQSWSSWMWGFVPSILPMGEDSMMSNANINVKALHFGLYVTNCALDMKLVEEGRSWQSLGKIQLEDVFLEMSRNNNDWANLQLGICLLSVFPAPQFDNEKYVACGRMNPDLMKMSLFENPDMDFPQRPWDVHLSSVTENSLLNRAPALAMDSLSAVEVLPDNWTDNFQAELRQKALTRFICGPLDINVTTGLIDRVRVIVETVTSYDYPRTTEAPSFRGPAHDFAPVRDKYFNDSFIPKEITQFTMCEACVRVYAAQIPLPGKKTKANLNTELIKTYSTKQQPHLLLRVKCVDVNLTRPLNPEQLQGLVLRNPPMEMFSEAMTTLSAGVMKVTASVLFGDTEVIDILDASKISTTMAFDSILLIEPDSIKCHRTLQIGELSVSTSKAKLLLANNIIESYLVDEIKTNPIYNSSLVQDSMNYLGVPFLKLTLSGFHFMFVSSQVNESYKIRLGSLTGQTFYFGENKARPKFTFLTAGSPVSKNIFEGVAQRPLSEFNTAPLLFYIKLKQLHVNVEKSLIDWILYKPKQMSTFRASRLGSGSTSRKISSSSLSSFSKKPTTAENVESLEKIVEKEILIDPPLSPTIVDYEKKEKRISMWLGLIVSADITDVAFTYSTSSSDNYLLVFKIPSVSICSNYGKLAMDCDELPVVFSSWVKNATSFPWSVDINGINAYSMLNGSQVKQTVLEPFSVNSTIAVTSKFTPNPTVSVTIHTDTSSISIAAGRHEINAVLDLVHCSSLVMNSLGPAKSKRKFNELPIDLNQSSDESCSRSRSMSIPVNQSEPTSPTEVGTLKVSCWLQWTLAKFTLTLFTSSTSVTCVDDLKLGSEFEDIIISSDMDINARVYQKLKIKIGSSSIKYFSREFKHFPWKLGSFGGVVMRGHELSDNNSQFLSLTLTRVLASHYHSKLSNTSHQIKESVRQRTTPTDSYVMEIDLKLEPLDFVLSPHVLGKFVRLFEPILNRKAPEIAPLTSSSAPLDQFTTADLPLVYLDVEQIRVFLPASTLQPGKSYDTVVVVIDDIALRHEAVNPVTRKILRSDIYTSAQRARVTALPGSQLEDRQYQLDLSLQMSTGVWEELSPHVRGEQPTGPDNPAVYWNSGRGHVQNGAGLTPVVSPPVKICLILAPPIVTSGFVVSGLNFEVNVVTEIFISLCLEQLRLINHLIIECKSILPDMPSDLLDCSTGIDSGLDSSGSSSVTPASKPSLERVYRRANSSLISVSSSTPVNTKNMRQKMHTVPQDILFIGKGITLKLYSKDSRNSRIQPLFYILIAQPFVSLEKHGDTCIHKSSIFDLSAKIGTSENFTTSTRLDADDFKETVVVTKDGDPDPYKGIPPALFNFKATQVGMRLPVVDVELARPIKFSANLTNVKFFESVQLLVFDALDLPDHGNKRFDRGDSQSELETIKESNKFPQYISSLNVSSKQLVLELQLCSNEKRSVIFSISSMSSDLNFPSPNQIFGTFNVTALILSVVSPRASSSGPKPLISPWSFSLTGNLIREPWIASSLLTIRLSSDILEVEYSSRRVEALRDVLEEFRQLLARKRQSSLGGEEEEERTAKDSRRTDEEDQFYKDDLQAGVFQFVNNEPQPELPLAYQVIFPNLQVMAWAYPQPRCITSVTVLPVPFRNSEPEVVEVSLQYLDFLGWRDWIKFNVSESEIAEVELPAKPQVASTWRVKILNTNSPIDAQALAASLRVDSMFSGSLVPNVRFNLSLDCFQLSVWAGPTRVVTLPPPLTRFAPENPVSGEYPFAKSSVEQIKLRLLSWRNGSLEVEGDFRGRVDLINCRTLQEQCCVQPFPVHVHFESEPTNQSLSLIAGPILVYAAPSTTHTLVTAMNDAVFMSTVICNDTCYPVRIGQAGTNEDVTIRCLQCHFYSWRSVHQGAELRFSLVSQDDKHWSQPIQVSEVGNYPIQLADDSGRQFTVFIIIKALSSTMIQVLISGELIVFNNLEKSVDMRLVSSSITERQRYITVNPSGRAPSVLLCQGVKYSIRLSLESQWSGLVPLNSTSNSWLVKIPSEDKKDYTSVWCQIFKDSSKTRTLVVISPMYLIKSMLPCNANVLVKTEGLDATRTLKVPGRGAISNLLTPGTTTHNHSLTFHIDGNLPSSSPHVPLSYSAMDGKTPPPPAIPDVESLIDRTEMIVNEVRWPFLDSHWRKAVWGYANQPDTITHVKVKFCADRLQVANSLMVELQPWALVVNTLGLGIALQSSDRFLCALQHSCVLAPPPIEGIFYLLVELNDGYHKSNSLQLSDSLSFYKPQISGLIPLTDSVRIKVQAPNSVIYATIHSKVATGGVRILHFSSSFIISNLSDLDLRVAAFSVRRENCKFRVPSEIHSFTLSLPKSTSSISTSGEPLAEWHEIGYGPEASRRLYLIFERDGLVSNPVPVETKSERGTQTALLPILSSSSGPRSERWATDISPTVNVCLEVVFQVKEGVTYVSVDKQSSPQLIVHNRTRQLLAVAKSAKEQGGSAVDESEDWEWRFMLPGCTSGHYKFELDNASSPLPPIVVAKPEYNGWSSPISLVPSVGARLVSLPHSSDLMASVVRVGFTVHLVLVYANHSLISAGDVRCRLSISSQHELPRVSESEEPHNISDSKPDDEINCHDMEVLKKSAFSRVKVSCFLRGVTIMLCSEPNCSFHWQEITALTVDNVAVTVQPVPNPDSNVNELEARITIWDLQIDNQEFQKGGYDFSVVLLRQGELDRSVFLGSHLRPERLIKAARQSDPAVDMTLLLNMNVTPALQEVSLEVAPFQIYVEDTYLTNLMNHLGKMIPTLLITGEKNHKTKEHLSPCKSECGSKLYEDLDDRKTETSKPDIKKDEEELFNVSDSEEAETPVSLSPWKEAHSQASSRRRRREEDSTTVTGDDEEFVWIDDCVDSSSVMTPSSITSVPFPEDIIRGSHDLLHPLRLKKFLIAPLSVLVSLHTSTKFYIALDQSPLSFSEFKRIDMITTPYRLGHALTLHYFLGAIYGTGWALGSLQLLGAPAGLARSFGHGLRSFLVLPYRGIMEGPTGFLLGVIHGSASLMKHITAGTLTSVNKLAGSWSRTLDRLTLNAEDLKYAEEMRRNKPQGLAEGLRQGFTEFGVSVLGGVGGLAQQPMEYAAGSSSQSLVGSLGRGLVGVMARPISGAAELVALTAHGILSGAGWAETHLPKHQAICQGVHQGVESRIKYKVKQVPKGETLLFICEATSSLYEPVVLVVTSFALYVLNRDDVIIHQVKLQNLNWVKDKCDPTSVKITVQTPDSIAERLTKKRISEFVRDSQRALSSVSPGSSLPPSPPHSVDQEPLKFFLNPQRRDHFVTMLDLAARHAAGKGFATFV